MAHVLTTRVYLEDTDAGGVVYHTGYLRFMERARTEALRRIGVEQSTGFGSGSSFVVHRVTAHFLSPARLDDELAVTCVLDQCTGARVNFKQSVSSRDGTRVHCNAEVEVACINLKTGRPQRIPTAVLAGLKQWM
jgi:tol-pal system-associated acyl-CoA thioesterase